MLPVVLHRTRVAAGAMLLAVVLSSGIAGPAEAQRRDQEFVRQGLLVPGFMVAPGVDPRAAMRAGDAARDGARDRSSGREVEVIGTTIITTTMQRAGYRPIDAWLESDIRALGEHTRADEYLVGRVEDEGRGNRTARVSGVLVLMRNARMRQPLPTFTASDLDDAARQLGHAVATARVQLPHLRRCENALRAGDARAAARAARAGIAVYPPSTLARACLAWALRAAGAPAAEILEVARQMLAVDTLSHYGLEEAATALDSLRRPAESAPLWVRLARSDTADLELTDRVLWSLYEGGSLQAAEELAVRSAREQPDYLPFMRHQWRASYDRQNWHVAIAAGTALLAQDSLARADPVFFRRLAAVYRAAGRPFEAVEMVARGVARFPDDARLYALYTQYIMAEADTALPRGLAQFPKNGELLALHAQRLRAGGRLADAIDAMRHAIAVDSTIPDAALMLAQAEVELGRADSALVSLRAALATGGDSVRIAQFLFARGSGFYRAAQGTKTAADHALSVRFLALADSVRSTPQTRLVLGMAALGVAQAAFTEAVAESDTARRCVLARQGADVLPIVRTALEGARDASAEAVEQGLAYLGQLEPYSGEALRGMCRG